MNRSNVIIITIALAFFIGILIFLFASNGETHFNWNPDYRSDSDEPYGTLIFSRLTDDYFPGQDREIVSTGKIKEVLNNPGAGHKIYMFIGESAFYSDSTIESLLNFVSSGNEAFFAVDEIPIILSQRVIRGNSDFTFDSTYYIDTFGDTVSIPLEEENTLVPEDDKLTGSFLTTGMTMNYNDPVFRSPKGYRFVFRVKEKPYDFEWRYFMPEYLQGNAFTDNLGTIQSRNFCNFIRVPYGDGYFYFHLTPIAFTNLFMLEEQKVEYASKVLSYFEPGDIIWDQYSMSFKQKKNNDDQQEGPLKFILSQTSLRWAWYLLLAGMAAFLIFRTKRMQQSIPVIEPNENKSLEFVQTIGRMYLLRNKHHYLVTQKMKLFNHFIQERYQLHTTLYDSAFMEKLHMKSEIPMEDIEGLYELANKLEAKQSVTADELILLHNTLDKFYKHCK